ncbi:MAG: helix-hairpin-helix domain-containing protein [Alteromonadales bacterium]|nr:helix-hairpin-helix domain-containing protein [Alteromonadales bacterium]
MKGKIIIVVVIALILGTTAFVIVDKPDIHEATHEELVQISGIGDTLSQRVLSYLEHNKTATIDDLVDVRGIGEVKLNKIRGKYD